MPSTGRIPLWLKIVWTVFMIAWVPVYWSNYGPANFLWICDVANFLILAALWLESPLLISSQAVGVLIIQAIWLIDVSGRLLFGFHPIGGTEYMFDPGKPLALRCLSLFHIAVPPLLLWAVRRLGYERNGLKLQTAVLWILLPATYFLTDPEANINWLLRPFGIDPPLIPRPWVLPATMLAIPIILCWPTHRALAAWDRRRLVRSSNAKEE